jgi:hypothetical protein
LGEKYKWVLKMLLCHIVGRQVWKNQVETGNRKPSKVATTSDEALLLVAMDCYWNVWAAKAKHESENGNREYPRNMPSAISSGKRIYCKWCSGKWCMLHCF